MARVTTAMTERLRVAEGPVDLSRIDAGGKPGFGGRKKDGKKALPAMAEELSHLQTQLFAAGYTGDERRILLVLQGMDTSGKGGVLSHVVGMLDPSAIHLKSFKKPTPVEARHDFLWRVKPEVPGAGHLGIFDRSHYEDVLVARVHRLAPREEIERRYEAINRFEKRLVDSGTAIIKVMLHISPEEQRERLLARLDDPTKQWKFKPDDIDERGSWSAYQRAYELALERCNTEHAPWHVVPSDRKWYRNWAIGALLLETLRGMDLAWPEPSYDVAQQRARLAQDSSLA